MSTSISATRQGLTIDLRAIEAHLDCAGEYTTDLAQDDVRLLLAAVRRFEEQRATVARLIDMAIFHGADPLAVERLDDALDELEQEI